MYKVAALISLAGLAAATAVPSSTPDCWSTCFAKNGVTSESSLCGNTAVDSCIHEECSQALEEKYCSWYDDYCGTNPTPSSSAPVWSSSAPAWSSSVPAWSSSTPASPVTSGPPTSTPTCWTDCFKEAGIESESDLCGNTEVDKCIQDNCSKAEDKAYWAWYESYCPAPSSSVPVGPASSSAPASPSQTPSCWGKCFSEAGIESESDLCGNTQVDKCIQDSCSSAEDKKYWEWYDSYCPSTSSPVSSSTPVSPSSPSQTPGCWSKCFAENDITSESALCGNTAVDQCIQDTCSAAEDKAYWDWYNGYCSPVTTIVTVTSTASCSTGAYPTTYTTGVPASPAGYPSSPVAPAAPPYSSPAGAAPAYSSPAGAAPAYSSPAAAGTGYAQPSGWGASPSASGYPVAATGAGVINKPSALFAAVVAIAALF